MKSLKELWQKFEQLEGKLLKANAEIESLTQELCKKNTQLDEYFTI